MENAALYSQAQDLTISRQLTFFGSQSSGSHFRSNPRGSIFTTEDSTKPILNLKPNETLYVVGHGNRETPFLSGYNPHELADILRYHGLCPGIKNLKIQLVCCHSGHKPDRFTLSFAEELYFMLLKDIHPMERYHMEKEGSTLSLKAPKHVIGFRKTDGKEIGLKPRDYDAYQRIKDESPEQLDVWLNQQADELTAEDFQCL